MGLLPLRLLYRPACRTVPCLQLSILVPCLKNFVLEGFHDCLPEAACSLRSTETAALHAAQGWAGALTIMALAALVSMTGAVVLAVSQQVVWSEGQRIARSYCCLLC